MRAAQKTFLLYFLFTGFLFAQQSVDRIFDYLNLDYPGLEKVKAVVQNKNFGAAKKELLEYFRERKNRVFPEMLLDLSTDIIAAYENAENRLNFKSHQKSFGEKIDWTYIAEDKEWNYSLNRMNWFTNFAGVYRKNKDERLVQAWKKQVLSWIALGNPGFPRTIDTGRRIEYWVKSYFVFVSESKSSSVDPEFNSEFLASIYEQCEYSYMPEHWRRYSNWGTFENSGFSLAAVMFPEFKRSDEWLKEIFFRMHTQMHLSFYNDGMHVELSPSYHAHELEVWFNFLVLTETNKIKNPWSPQRELPLLRSMLVEKISAFAQFVQPSGKVPQIGDTGQMSLKGFLETAGYYLGSPEYQFISSGGKNGTPPSQSSIAFPEAGFFISRSGWGKDANSFSNQNYLLFDCTLNKPWHSHFDALNIIISANGNEYLTDPGIFTYNDGPDRNLFKSSSYHNTVVINGQEQNESEAKPETYWRYFNGFDLLRGSRIQDGVFHERNIISVGSEYWLVLDKFEADGNNKYEQYWHLDSEFMNKVKQEKNRITLPGFSIVSDWSHGKLSLEKYYQSYYYREKVEAPVVKYSESVNGSLLIPTLFYPDEKKNVQLILPENESDKNRTAGLIILRFENYTDYLIMKIKDGDENYADIITDAETAFIRVGSNGDINAFTLIGGSFLYFKGECLTDSFGDKIDISYNGNLAEVSGINIKKLKLHASAETKLTVNNENVTFLRDGKLIIYD